MLLPVVTRFSLPGAAARYATVARTMNLCDDQASDADAGQALLAGLEQLNKRLQIPRLRDARGVEQGAFEEALPKMASDALASGSPANNPEVPTVEQIIQLYLEAW